MAVLSHPRGAAPMGSSSCTNLLASPKDFKKRNTKRGIPTTTTTTAAAAAAAVSSPLRILS